MISKFNLKDSMGGLTPPIFFVMMDLTEGVIYEPEIDCIELADGVEDT